MSEFWAADAPISMPVPPPGDVPVVESFGALGFSMNGIVHDITEADLEDLATPMYAPEGFRGAPYRGRIEGDRPRMNDDGRL